VLVVYGLCRERGRHRSPSVSNSTARDGYRLSSCFGGHQDDSSHDSVLQPSPRHPRHHHALASHVAILASARAQAVASLCCKIPTVCRASSGQHSHLVSAFEAWQASTRHPYPRCSYRSGHAPTSTDWIAPSLPSDLPPRDTKRRLCVGNLSLSSRFGATDDAACNPTLRMTKQRHTAPDETRN
jgi:hypothetical protein